MIIIYITCKDNAEAQKIAQHLLEQKLIACANVYSIQSMYHWKGKIQNDEEYVCICKTLADKYELVKLEVKKIHSYEIPCILKIDAEGNEEYITWLGKELSRS